MLAVKQNVWEGPDSPGPQGGVTQSLLGRFLTCRERFRLMVTEGLKASEGWNHKLGYGSMFHVCEEHVHGDWQIALTNHCLEESRNNPFDRDRIEHWWAICMRQFPLYLDYWSRHPQTRVGEPLMREQEFRVPYTLRWSGRTVYLRGKWDGLDKCSDGLWQREHKTKGDLDAQAIARQLRLDLQTMFYRVALDVWYSHEEHQPIRGVLYNCVRRPLSGGKGTIRQKMPTKANPLGESRDDFLRRVGSYIREEPHEFFMRFESEVSEFDVERFRRLSLDPILEQLCDWWECVNGGHAAVDCCSAYQNYLLPYGVYSPLHEGRATDLDTYLETGSEAGLTRVRDLFPELTDGKEARADAGGADKYTLEFPEDAVVQSRGV